MASAGDDSAIGEEVRSIGFSFAPAEQFRALLTPAALAEWPSFAASWGKAHQPHYQSRPYNPINGGIERWFEPVTEAIRVHPVTLSLLDVGREVFDTLTPELDRPQAWHVELHQFRIEARAGQTGKPTPEGLHRDGADWVLVVLVDRKNVESGITSIFGLDQSQLGDFTLTDPLDAVFLQDNRVFHGVTAIRALKQHQAAHRDVAVITFRAAPLRLPSPV